MPSKDDMDILAFIASLVQSLAWPAAIVVCAWTFRAPILKLLSTMRSLKYGDLKMDFGEELTDIEASIQPAENVELSQQDQTENVHFRKLAEGSPRGAVIEAWLSVEQSLLDLAEVNELDVKGSKGRVPRRLIQELAKRRLISPDIEEQILALLNLRNQAAHVKDMLQITPVDAIRYKELADRLAKGLEKHLEAHR